MVRIEFGPNANREAVAPSAMQVIEDLLEAAGVSECLITSTARSPADQVRAMYHNIERKGVEHQKQLYAQAGDQVIDAYSASKAAGNSATQIKADMEARIISIGPSRVSKHCADPAVLCVVDIAPSSIGEQSRFVKVVEDDARVRRLLKPPKDPTYHLEIPV